MKGKINQNVLIYMFFTFPSGLFGAAPFLKNSKNSITNCSANIAECTFPQLHFFPEFGPHRVDETQVSNSTTERSFPPLIFWPDTYLIDEPLTILLISG